jgi:hypothetical protein
MIRYWIDSCITSDNEFEHYIIVCLFCLATNSNIKRVMAYHVDWFTTVLLYECPKA